MPTSPDTFMADQTDLDADAEEFFASSGEGGGVSSTWVAVHRNCSCCGGHIYSCKGQVCQQLGVCTCAYEDEGMHESESHVCMMVP